MDPDFIAARRDSFLTVTPDYERTRPGYPVEAIRWALGTKARTVVDLGCGPGKLSSQLAELGHRVWGLDPSLSMLQGMRSKGLPAVAVTKVRRLCSEHPDLLGRPTFDMPYRTRVFRATPL